MIPGGPRGRGTPEERPLGASVGECGVPLQRSHGCLSALQKPVGSGTTEGAVNGRATDAFACLSLGNTLSPARLPVIVAQLPFLFLYSLG